MLDIRSTHDSISTIFFNKVKCKRWQCWRIQEIYTSLISIVCENNIHKIKLYNYLTFVFFESYVNGEQNQQVSSSLEYTENMK